MNKIMIKEEFVIQTNIIPIKIYYCPDVKPKITYIISFTKKIRIFVLFGLSTSFKEI